MIDGNQIKQVIAAWPFMNAGPKWSVDTFLNHCSQLGVAGVELLPVEFWPRLREYDMICAASKSHTFVRGMNNINHHPECLAILKKTIEETSAAGFPNVMTFTGLADTSGEPNGSKVDPVEGMQNCIKGYKEIMPLAERLGVTLVLEPLNSKVPEEMKGHPGYQGDHIDYCIEIIKKVGSPSLKLLFDVYHIQIMDGDLINHFEKNFDYLGHVQVAGVPGRGEIGKNQEINYRGIMRKISEMGYDGFVGHEWIPTGDPITGLREAVQICDI